MKHSVSGWAVRFTRMDGSYFYSYGSWPLGYSFFKTRREAREFVTENRANGIGKYGATVLYATITLVIQG